VAYRADIEIAVKGAQELKRLQDRIQNLTTSIDTFNSKIANIGNGVYSIRNINNLTDAVSDAAEQFNRVALGTSLATTAARVYIDANNALNTGLAERVALLKQVNEQDRIARLTAAGIKETTAYTRPVSPGPRMPAGGFPSAGPLPVPGFEATQKSVGKFGENLALGAGFPLLFGAGPGSIAGSIAGSFVGSGFGGQILGGALGAVIDSAVISVQKLGNAFVLAGDSYANIREQGAYFTAELEKQVNLTKAQGNFAKAQELQKSAMTVQTGDVGGLANTGATAAVNELQKAWNGVTKAVGTTLAILAAPFLFALDAILRGVQAIFMVVNLAITGIGNLVNLIPGASQLGAQLAEEAQKGTVEYENQLAELDKQITSNSKNLELLRAKNGLLARSLTMSKVAQEIDDKKIAALERVNAFEEELRKLRESAPIGTTELRNKLAEQEAQLKQKFALEEKAIALKDARDIFNAIIENNRNIKYQQRANELEYQDMVLQGLRAQQDLNLEVLRKVQDTKMRMREQELQYEQKLTAEQIKRQQLNNREQTLQGSINAVLSSDPEQANVINTVRSALSEWRTGRMSVEAEAAQKQQEIQLNYLKAQVAIERYKYDNALKIARTNEDSQRRIAKVNEGINKQNEEISRMQYTRALGAVRLGLIQQGMQQERQIKETDFYLELKKRKVPGSESMNTEALNREKQQAIDMANLLRAQLSDIERQFVGLTISKLTPMAQVPKMANTSASATAEETAANLQLKQYEQTIAHLQKINGLKENDLKLAEQILKPNSELLNQYNAIIKQQKDKAAFEREYGNLIRTGTLPEIAKELADLKIAKDLTESTYNTLINTFTALPSFTKDPVLQDIVKQLNTLKTGLNTKVAEAGGAITEGASTRNRLQIKSDELRGELNKLQDPVNQLVTAADAIGTAFSTSFKGIIDGSMTAREALGSFFQSVADAFLDMAAQIIAKWIQMTILNSILALFPGGAKAPGSGFDMGAINKTGLDTFNPANSFANLGRRAMGGPVAGGTPYIVGERGPELFMPGRSGTIIPNDALGGGSTSVVVNVDASGNSNVQSDQQQARQLGVAVSAAVQAELVKQQRPGGLLAGTRR
jgi:oligoribonuclease (3'-5' exoribonuclease)